MTGAIYAMGCALAWAVSLVLLKLACTRGHPFVVNWHKNLLGFSALILTYLAVEGWRLPEISWQELALIALSGFMGIGIADAMALYAVKRLEGGHLAILEALYTPMVILLAVLLLGEWPQVHEVLGILLVMAAVLMLNLHAGRLQFCRATWIFIWALLMQAFGIIMIKPLLSTVPLLYMVVARMAFGVLASWLVLAPTSKMLFHQHKLNRLGIPHWGGLVEILRQGGIPWKVWLLYIGACLMSAYVAMILWIAGYKYNQAAVAAILNQTSTFMTLFLATLFLKEELTKRKLWASVVAFVGVAFILV